MATRNLVENYIDPIRYGKTPEYERKQGERNWNAAMTNNGVVKTPELDYRMFSVEDVTNRMAEIGLSQTALAGLTGMTQTSISEVLRGKRAKNPVHPDTEARRMKVLVNHLWGDGSLTYTPLTKTEVARLVHSRKGQTPKPAAKPTIGPAEEWVQVHPEAYDHMKQAMKEAAEALRMVKVLEKRVADLKWAQRQFEEVADKDFNWQEQIQRTNKVVDALRSEVAGFRELLMHRGASASLDGETITYDAADRRAAVDAITNRVMATKPAPALPWWRRLFG